VKHQNLGFEAEQLLYLKVNYSLKGRIQILADKLQQYHAVKSLTKTMGVPGEIHLRLNDYETIVIDSTSIKTFGFRILQGRDLMPGDVNKACLINSTALKNFPDGDYHNHKMNGSEIVGVVSDFHYSSLHNKIGPLILIYNPEWGATTITMRVSGSIGEAVEYIKKTWRELCPEYPMDLGFYDEHFASMYRKEENLASLVSIFSILAIVISCMGIFGLSVFQAEQRVKEIGIRKVLGATEGEIVLLLTKSFSLWVVYAVVIAFPIAYYLLDKWLQDFAYRIQLQWWMFVLAGGIAFLIALMTISVQAIKSAMADPVKSLKYE
jgi:putative ABC transport system permease protein